MSVLLDAPGDVPARGPVLRVCLDVNVFITDLLGTAQGRNSSSSQVVEMVRRGWCALGPVQLVVSWTMLETLGLVLTRKLGRDDVWVNLIVQNIADMAAGGALYSPPHLLLGGTGTRPMRDAEDGTVLDAALAGKAELLITGDVDDFLRGGKSTLPTDLIARRRLSNGKLAPAVAAIPRYCEAPLIIAMPQEAIVWLSRSIDPTLENLRAHYGVPAPQTDTAAEATGGGKPGGP